MTAASPTAPPPGRRTSPATRTIEIAYAVRPVLRDSPCGLKTAEMGSLVFSVPIPYEKIPHEYERNGVERKYPYCDYEYRGIGDWNYAYCADTLVAEEREVGDTPFSSEKPPVVLKAKMRKIDWGLEDGFDTVCAAFPESLDPVGGEEEVVLFPYGCAKLRMTQMPLCERLPATAGNQRCGKDRSGLHPGPPCPVHGTTSTR